MPSLDGLGQVGKRGVTLAYTAVSGAGVVFLIVETCQVNIAAGATVPRP